MVHFWSLSKGEFYLLIKIFCAHKSEPELNIGEFSCKHWGPVALCMKIWKSNRTRISCQFGWSQTSHILTLLVRDFSWHIPSKEGWNLAGLMGFPSRLGLLPCPEFISPFRYPGVSEWRKSVALERMKRKGFIRGVDPKVLRTEAPGHMAVKAESNTLGALKHPGAQNRAPHPALTARRHGADFKRPHFLETCIGINTSPLPTVWCFQRFRPEFIRSETICVTRSCYHISCWVKGGFWHLSWNKLLLFVCYWHQARNTK